MNNTSKIEVCEHCSGLDVGQLKARAKIKLGCIGKCSKKCPELQGKAYGFLNGEFVATDTQDQFFAKVDALGGYIALSNRNPLVDAFLDHAEAWRDEFIALRTLILDTPLTEELKWGQPCYALEGGNVLILGGFKDYIALSFFKGALLTDPSGILVRQTENVQAGRQLRFTGVQQIEQMKPFIMAYIYEAIEVEKAGLKTPVEKRPELGLPEELQVRFDRDPALKIAFDQLTPGRQRGYLYHFTQPKQSKTRDARIEKCAPKILDGKGLED